MMKLYACKRPARLHVPVPSPYHINGRIVFGNTQAMGPTTWLQHCSTAKIGGDWGVQYGFNDLDMMDGFNTNGSHASELYGI